MNLKLLSAKVFFLFLIFGINDLHSQVIGNVNMREVPNTDFTIQGDFIMVGNAISGLSRIPGTTTPRDPNLPYNGTSNNNGNSFGYIDIDSDPSTFSSSSAVVNTGGVCSRVVYAGLYWTATYYTRKQTDNDAVYSGLPVTDNRAIEDGLPGNFRDVKFKPPGSTDYIDISVSDGVFTGTSGVLFDGWRNTATNSSNIAVKDVPYVCYAEVTDLIPDLDAADGEYFVGNIRSTIGPSRNGVSGGWVLVIIYEDTTLPTKLLSSRFGFKQIGGGGSPDVEFLYDDFRTLPAPNPVNARYGLSTLEGDFSIVGDQLQLFSDPNPVAIGWRSMFALPENTSTNFFNSTISIDGNHNLNRTPASQNTLGLEIDVFDIPNFGNELIGNDQTSARFRTTTSGDSYSVFVNAFSIEVIEPKLTVTKRVFDITGTDITGDPVNFGDQLFYELTIENNGNEDITAASIRDVLPDNVDFTVGTITTSNPGIVGTPDPTSRQIDVTITDDLVVRGGGLHTVRFGVRVVATCADLRDACSNQINNIAISTYTGVDSGITRTGEESILELDACRFDIEGSSNVLINDGICFTESIPSFFCTGSLVLTAGDGFANYTWTYVDDPSVTFPNTQSITVTLPGTYTVLETGAPGCLDSQLTFVVDSFTTVTNPVIDVVAALGSNPVVNGNIRTCPITGESLPEIFLCGAGTTLNIPLSFAAGTTVVWERLDPSACPTVTRDPDCPTPIIDSGACDGEWVEVSTDVSGYTLTEAGEYRIRATFDRGCTVPFYFNAFKNNFKPNLVVIREIICGTPGTLRVNNSSVQYEYQLIAPSGATTVYQNSPEFAGLTEVGNYTVNARQRGGLPTACVFQDTEFLDELDADEVVTVTSPACPDGRGTISITVTDSKINYTYTINSTTTAFTDSEGPTTTPSHTFTGLVPDTYEIQVLSADGSCSETFTRVVTPAAAFSATVRLVSDLKCNPAYQPDITLPDFDDDEFIAIYEVTVTGGSGTFEFNDRMDFLGTVLEPLTGTTYQFRATAAGNYPVYVGDLVGGCTINAGSVDVTPYEAITATATPINPDCSGSLGAIDVTITAGLAENPFTYILDAGTATEVRIGPSNNTTERFNNVDPTVSHTVTVEDQFGCDFVITPDITFTSPAGITATINDDFRLLSCTATPGAQAQVTAIAGGSGTYEWSLNPAGPFTAVVGLPFEVDFAAAGSYTLYIRNQVTPPTDSCVESFPITIAPLLEVDDITFVLGDSDCTAQTIEVTATAVPAGPTYTYSAVPAPVSGDAATGVFVLNRGVTYTFTATRGDNSCDYSEDFRQELVPEVQITNAVETSPTTCNAGADGALSFTVGNSAAFTYAITGPTVVAGGAGVGVIPVPITGLEAGVYTITVTDSNLAGGSPPNCQTSTTVTITEPTVVTFTIDPVDQDCAADTNTVTISGVMGGSGSGYTYILNDSGGVAVGPSRPIATPYENVPNALGYQIIVTDGAGCPSAPQTLNINQLPQLDASVDAASDFCLDDGTVSFTINIDGTDSGTPDYTYNVTRSGVVVIADTNVGALTTFTTTPALTQPGDYVITITDSNGCPVVLPTQTIAPAVELVATQVADITCDALGAPVDAEFSFVVTGGYTPYDIAVSIDGGAFADHLTNATAPFANYTNGTAGSYVFRVTDDRGCTFTTLPIIVSDPVAPTITAPTVALDCFGDLGTAVINVTGTETPYQIDFQNTGTFVTITGTQITFPNLGEAVYPFTVRSSRGCLYPDDVEITTPDVITEVSRLETPVTCGGSATVTDLGAIDLTIAGGTGPYEYTLVRAADFAVRPLVPAATAVATPNPVTTGTTVRFEGLDFGQYFIFVTDDNGCEDNAPFGPFDIFSPPDDLLQRITVSATCPGGVTFEIDVQGGSGITPPADPPPGFDIRIVGEPSPGLGDFVPLDDSVGGATAVDATTPIRDHTYSGLSFNRTYILEVRDNATNCLYQELVPAELPPSSPNIINDVVTNVTCNPSTDDGTLNFDINGYDPSVTEVSWEVFNAFTNVTLGAAFTGSTAGLTGADVPVVINNLPPGEYYVTILEVDGTMCPARYDFTIDLPDPIVSAATNQTPANSCGTNAQVIMSTSGGVQFAIPPTADGYQYALIADDGFGAPVTTPTLITDFALTSNIIDLGNTNGQVQHIFVIGNNDGCTFGPITVTTVVNPLPTVTAPAFVDDACTYDNNYTFQVVGTGLGTLTYQLDGGTAVTGSIDNENHVFTVSSAGTYTVTITDETGCTNTDTIDVYDPLLINAEFTTAPDCSSVPPLGVITTTLDPTSPVAVGTLTYELQDSTGTPTGNTSGDATGVYTDVAPGSYIVEVTDDGRGPAPGCSFTAPVSIEAPTEPALLAQPNTQVTCNGDTDGVITAVLDPATLDPDPTVTYTYAITAPLASVTAEQASPVFSGLAPGSYTVRVTATKPNGTLSVVCTDDQVYTIDDPTVVVADRSIVDDLACGAANTVTPATIAITIDATTGTGPDYFVTVTQPDGVIRTRIPVPTPIPAPPAAALTIDAPVDGTYAFTVFDSNNCPLVLPTIDVAPLPVMTDPTVTPGAPIDCVTNVQAVTVSITGGAGPFDIVETSRPALTQTGILAGTGDVDPPPGVQTTATFNLPGVGNYVFEITDTTTGCTIQTPVFNVPEYDTIEATIVLGNNITCFNTVPPDGSVNLTVTNYTGTYDYVATNSSTVPVTTVTGSGNTATDPATGLVIPGLAAGDITVVVTATQTPFCDATSNVVAITQPPAILVRANQIRDESCNPGNDALIEAVASGGTGTLEYQLEDAVGGILVAFGSDPRFGDFGLDGGVAPAGIDYVVRVRDATGCEQTDTINIQPPVPLGLNPIAAITLDCADSEDGVIVAVATGGQGVGTYFFSLTFPDGSVSAAVNNGTNTFQWRDLKPGNYIVTVSDNLACEAIQNPVVITAPPAVTVDVTPTGISCLTANPNNILVTGGGGVPGYTYGYIFTDATTGAVSPIVWQPGDTFVGLPEGDYDFYVRDTNLCESPASTRIQVRNPKPFVATLDTSNFNIVCFSEATGSVDAVVTGGLGSYGYRVNGTDYLGNPVNLPGPTATDTQTTSFFGDLLAGTYTYTVISGDCVDRILPFEITQPLEFLIDNDTTPISCNGETDGSIRVFVEVITPPGTTGGTPPYFFSLYNSAGDAVFTFIEDDSELPLGEHTFTDLPADTYRVEVEDNNGCPKEILDIIIVEPDPILATVDSTTPEECVGDMNGTATISITGGLPPVDPADPSYFWSIDGVTYLPVADPTALLIDNLPGGTTTVFIRDSRNNPDCQGAFNIEIEPGVNLDATLEPRLVCPIFDYTDPMNPVMTNEEQYFIDFNIIAESEGLDIIYTLNGINGTPNPPSNTNLTGTFEVAPGEYEGIMESSLCVRTIGTIEIIEYIPLAIPFAEMTNNPKDPNEYRILASGGRQFEKDPFYVFSFTILEEGVTLSELEDSDFTELDGNIFVIRETADYVLRVVDADGCEVLVVQNLTYINIRIPNYFTPDDPNSSIEERFWYPRQITPNIDDPFFFENIEVTIFDRFGRVLAEYKGDQKGWTGQYQGKQLPSGDYWYTIILNDVDNREFTGHFTLYR